MDRMWLTHTDRIETVTRGAAAGTAAGALLGAFEMVAAAAGGDGVLWPWRMASSIVLGQAAFAMSPAVILVTGVLVHLMIAVVAGVVAAMLYEWSEWSRHHRPGPGSTCLGGALFGGMVWLLNFPLIAGAFYPWMWRLHQEVQLALHLWFGGALGLALSLLGRYVRNPPDAARPA
jgi:hypothetical protein